MSIKIRTTFSFCRESRDQDIDRLKKYLSNYLKMYDIRYIKFDIRTMYEMNRFSLPYRTQVCREYKRTLHKMTSM